MSLLLEPWQFDTMFRVQCVEDEKGPQLQNLHHNLSPLLISPKYPSIFTHSHQFLDCVTFPVRSICWKTVELANIWFHCPSWVVSLSSNPIERPSSIRQNVPNSRVHVLRSQPHMNWGPFGSTATEGMTQSACGHAVDCNRRHLHWQINDIMLPRNSLWYSEYACFIHDFSLSLTLLILYKKKCLELLWFEVYDSVGVLLFNMMHENQNVVFYPRIVITSTETKMCQAFSNVHRLRADLLNIHI